MVQVLIFFAQMNYIRDGFSRQTHYKKISEHLLNQSKLLLKFDFCTFVGATCILHLKPCVLFPIFFFVALLPLSYKQSTSSAICSSEGVAERASVKIGVLKSFTKLTMKHLWWSLSLIKLKTLRPADPQACNFIKKRHQHRYFPMKFAKFLRTPVLKNIRERLLLFMDVLFLLLSN